MVVSQKGHVTKIRFLTIQPTMVTRSYHQIIKVLRT